jgi:hypothetical protein
VERILPVSECLLPPMRSKILNLIAGGFPFALASPLLQVLAQRIYRNRTKCATAHQCILLCPPGSRPSYLIQATPPSCAGRPLPPQPLPEEDPEASSGGGLSAESDARIQRELAAGSEAGPSTRATFLCIAMQFARTGRERLPRRRLAQAVRLVRQEATWQENRDPLCPPGAPPHNSCRGRDCVNRTFFDQRMFVRVFKHTTP